ncbi:MAG: SDR family NAD(P)-dependent oxidoreductase [Myxococcales bacterium]|nr:SDR family NAD(P)-dependent oxidoreductase [Myxococcales bacterium]
MREDPFEGRLALVTGAASGIGAAMCNALAARGARLVICDVDARKLAVRQGALGGAVVMAETIDVGDREQMAALAEKVHAKLGPLDLLFNNAGVAVGGDLLTTPLEDWDWMLRANLWGVIYGCHFFGPAMRAAPGKAHIINTASAAGLAGAPLMGAYCASKCAVVGYSESLRDESDPTQLGVHVVCPGFLPTQIAASGRFSSDRSRKAADKLLNRPNRGPSDVALATLRAIERDRFLVLVYPEAWMQLARRVMPGGLARTVRVVTAQLTGPRGAEGQG